MTLVKYWKGIIKREHLKNIDWEIEAFKSDVEGTELVVFEIPKDKIGLVDKIEKLIQEEIN